MISKDYRKNDKRLKEPTNLDYIYVGRLYFFYVLLKFIKKVLAYTSYSMYNKDKDKGSKKEYIP